MATTTLAAVRDQIITTIEALTPASLSTDLFRRGQRRIPIKQWAGATNSSSAAFRKFELTRTGAADDPSYLHTTQIERHEQLTLTVAYPVLVGKYGNKELDDLESIARADAMQIRDAVYSSDNYLSGQIAAFVTIMPLDTSSGDVWFQEFTIEVYYYEAQSL